MLIGAVLFLAVLALVSYSWPTIAEAFRLMRGASPGWLALAALAIVAGFVCAGQIYGRVLAILGYRAPQPWLIAAALVSILISQAIPAGTVGSYTFLTASLRRRGVPATSVALLASLELCTWMGGMLVMFSFGILYKLLAFGEGLTATIAFPAMAALTVVGGFSFAVTRPAVTLHRWGWQLVRPVGRLLRRSWSEAHIRTIVEEIDQNRRLVAERPAQMLGLLVLQVLVFLLHSSALLLLLYAMGATARPFVVVSAYGLALIVSTFTALPGGGGTVEAALALALTAEGVPPEAALGATILFRLLSFWLLLPLGAVFYRLLTAGRTPGQTMQ
jgi:uncharacterized protein (TIRG00374 family)